MIYYSSDTSKDKHVGVRVNWVNLDTGHMGCHEMRNDIEVCGFMYYPEKDTAKERVDIEHRSRQIGQGSSSHKTLDDMMHLILKQTGML